MEAVQNCEKLAYEYGNQQIDQPHLLYSLLTLDDSLIMKLITKMGIQGDMFKNEAKQAIEKLTKVSGGGQLYISNDLNKVLINAEDEAKAMGDEYVSVEHLFLALLKQPSKEMKDLFKTYGITREKVPSGTFHCKRQSESGERQPGGNLRYITEIWLRSGRTCQRSEAGSGHRP